MKRYQFEEIVFWLNTIATILIHANYGAHILFWIFFGYNCFSFYCMNKYAYLSVKKKKKNETINNGNTNSIK
jgi:hypothetical protein